MLSYKLISILCFGIPILLLLSHSVCEKVKRTKEEITQEFLRMIQFKHMSSTSSRSFCSRENGMVIGVRIRTSSHLNQTNPSVTAIEFICSDRITYKMAPSSPLVLGPNIGIWGKVEECDRGFVKGMLFHLHYLEIAVSSLEDVNKDQAYFKYLARGHNVYSVWKNRYITGVSLFCSDDSDLENNPSLLLGKKTEYALRLVCLDHRMMAGMEVYVEAVSTYDGERLIPLSLQMACKRLINPLQRCIPDLRWNKISPGQCVVSPEINLTTYSSLANNSKLNIKCNVDYAVGTSLNQEITNLKEIMHAYEPLNLDWISGLSYWITMILKSPNFLKSWAQKPELQMSDYKKITSIATTQFIRMKNQTESLMFYDVSKSMSLERLIENQSSVSSAWKESLGNKTNKVQHEFVVHQLIGYCSIYKFYFPILTHEFQQYKNVKIAGISSRIVFQT